MIRSQLSAEHDAVYDSMPRLLDTRTRLSSSSNDLQTVREIRRCDDDGVFCDKWIISTPSHGGAGEGLFRGLYLKSAGMSDPEDSRLVHH